MRQERIRTQFTTHRPQRCRVRAFTLVEILMVITIIALLTSLLVVASMSILGISREAATKATLIKIGMLLDARKAAFSRYVETKLKTFSDPNPAQRILYRKNLQRKYFPQTWAEAGIKYDNGRSLLDENGITSAPASTGAVTESSEVLYWMLLNTRIPNQEETISDAFLTKEYVVPSGSDDVFPKGSRRPYFVDSWGKPLRFYRWCTRLIRPNGSPSTPTDPPFPADITQAGILLHNLPVNPGVDPDDPLNVCGALLSPSKFEDDYHTLLTYTSPLVVSAGADETLGLTEPNDPGPDRLAIPKSGESVYLNDNLTIQNIVAGASR